ncbi:IS630 family transposase [Microbulbifer sp. VAAF005]|uniref:IS630 family transposase n=1 Tax=Microbulbifer sp. VAAF005 TaxID=3034230 RepID=UPI0024AD1272|nr:IS630 family transposase [Microbulbifer sp. VAAF005]WHI46726.1 IS630 family transposase [Microbulbifer sp. VAAF005]
MKYDARKLSTEEQHLIRKIAVQRVFDGESAAEVSRSLGLGSRTIFPWLRTAREKGIEALSPKIRPGRGRKLSAIEEEEVKRWIIGGDPRQYGFDFGLWTRQIVSDLIFERFKIELSVSSVGTLLHRLGLTPQKPLRRAYERDEKAVNKWVKEVYPKIKSYAKKTGAEIFWLDEASIRSDDPLQRTWGEKGKTPVVKTSGQRQSINAISALSNRGGFWYHIYSGKFTAEKCVECFKNFQRSQKRPVILIVDGYPVHKSKKVLEYVDSQDGKLEMVFLPPYAPDLNPDELVWNHMRNIGTSKRPLKKGETLLSRANADLQSIKKNRKLVKSFFQESTVFFAAA